MTALTKESIIAEIEKRDGDGAFASIIISDSTEKFADTLAKATRLAKQLEKPVAFIHKDFLRRNIVFVTDGEGHDPITGKCVNLRGGGIGHLKSKEVAALQDIAKPRLHADERHWQELLEHPEQHARIIALLGKYFADALISSERGGKAWIDFVKDVRAHKDEHAEAMVMMESHLKDALTPSERKDFVAHIRECSAGCHDTVIALDISDAIHKNKPSDNQLGL